MTQLDYLKSVHISVELAAQDVQRLLFEVALAEQALGGRADAERGYQIFSLVKDSEQSRSVVRDFRLVMVFELVLNETMQKCAGCRRSCLFEGVPFSASHCFETELMLTDWNHEHYSLDY